MTNAPKFRPVDPRSNKSSSGKKRKPPRNITEEIFGNTKRSKSKESEADRLKRLARLRAAGKI